MKLLVPWFQRKENIGYKSPAAVRSSIPLPVAVKPNGPSDPNRVPLNVVSTLARKLVTPNAAWPPKIGDAITATPPHIDRAFKLEDRGRTPVAPRLSDRASLPASDAVP